MAAMTTAEASGAILEKVVAMGDLEQLKPVERAMYYARVCESVGLNPLTRPFEYVKLQGKLTLYARRDATDQLRKVHRVSVRIVARDKVDDLYIVTARATTPDGREDESTGAVSLAGLKGENLANALMKAETKAKRRVTLSICGLGWLDESEVQDVKAAKPVTVTPDGEIVEQDLTKQLAASVTQAWPAWLSKHEAAFAAASDLGELAEAWFETHEELKALAPPEDVRARIIAAKDARKAALSPKVAQ